MTESKPTVFLNIQPGRWEEFEEYRAADPPAPDETIIYPNPAGRQGIVVDSDLPTPIPVIIYECAGNDGKGAKAVVARAELLSVEKATGEYRCNLKIGNIRLLHPPEAPDPEIVGGRPVTKVWGWTPAGKKKKGRATAAASNPNQVETKPEPSSTTAHWPASLRTVARAYGLDRAQNLVLEGVPGTGKTHAIMELMKADVPRKGRLPAFRGRGVGRFAVTLHPAIAYEDFVEGLRPGPHRPIEEEVWWTSESYSDGVKNKSRPLPKIALVEDRRSEEDLEKERWFFDGPTDQAKTLKPDETRFSVHDGFFVRVCHEAVHYPHRDFLILLDEINRCNVPKVLGDLLTTLESSKRATWAGTAWDISTAQTVTLPYSKRLFFIPDNVFVLATMNTTDRSVAPLDSALRRRFAFHRLWPLGFEEETRRQAIVSQSSGWQDLLEEITRQVEDKAAQRSGEKVVAAGIDISRHLLAKLPRPYQHKGGGDPEALLRLSVCTWVTLTAALLRDLGPDAMLGHSYLFDLAGVLGESPADRRWRGQFPGVDALVEHHWNQHLLTQLADSLESNNSVDLVDSKETALSKVLPAIASRWKQAKWTFSFRVEGKTNLLRQPVFRLRKG